MEAGSNLVLKSAFSGIDLRRPLTLAETDSRKPVLTFPRSDRCHCWHHGRRSGTRKALPLGGWQEQQRTERIRHVKIGMSSVGWTPCQVRPW